MEEIKKESAGRGNVILLTVIAIVTMIIVVVGATFAYLASSVQSGDTSNLNAITDGGSDLLLINAGDDIDIEANLTNFYEGAGNLTGTVDANVLLQTSSNSPVTYDYRVYLEVPHNDFEYSSGTCYVRSAATMEADSAAACKLASADNIWATVDGSSYGCYGTSEKVVNTFYNNEVACLTSANYMWAAEEVAELVLDLYQSDDSLSGQATCETVGVCVDGSRNIVSGSSSKADCESSEDNTWLPNIYEDGICYGVVKTADLTISGPEENISLMDTVSITAASGGTTHYYKGIVTLINFGHNQLVNGHKSFNCVLNFERIIETP